MQKHRGYDVTEQDSIEMQKKEEKKVEEKKAFDSSISLYYQMTACIQAMYVPVLVSG